MRRRFTSDSSRVGVVEQAATLRSVDRRDSAGVHSDLDFEQRRSIDDDRLVCAEYRLKRGDTLDELFSPATSSYVNPIDFVVSRLRHRRNSADAFFGREEENRSLFPCCVYREIVVRRKIRCRLFTHFEFNRASIKRCRSLKHPKDVIAAKTSGSISPSQGIIVV